MQPRTVSFGLPPRGQLAVARHPSRGLGTEPSLRLLMQHQQHLKPSLISLGELAARVHEQLASDARALLDRVLRESRAEHPLLRRAIGRGLHVLHPDRVRQLVEAASARGFCFCGLTLLAVEC